MKTAISAALAATASLFIAFQPANASTTYVADFYFGNDTELMHVEGTIETDGTTGWLSTSNILGWDLTWTFGEGSVSFDESNSGLSLKGSQSKDQGFYATDTTLSVGHGSSTYHVYFYDLATIADPVWYLMASWDYCPGSYTICTYSNISQKYVNIAAEFPYVVGTVAAVPLPATLPLMIVGLAGLGWVGRRRTSRPVENLIGQTA